MTHQPCPSCERDLSYPGQPGHECYTHADRARNIAAREARERALPTLPEGWDYLTLNIPVDVTRPVDLDELARTAGDAARMMGASRFDNLAPVKREAHNLNCPVCGSGEEGDCPCDRAEAIARAKWVSDGMEAREGPWETVLGDMKKASLIRKALPDAHEEGR